MINSLKLTIVIPVYNEEDHLKNCLDAIASQTIAPDEVIVVDNNSTDRSVAIAKQYSFVTMIRASEQGIVHARNVGFDRAESNLIGRIDSDTVLPPEWVENVKSYYSRTDLDFVLTGGGYFYNVPLERFNGWILGQLAYRLNRLIMGHYIVWGSNMVIPNKLWQQVKNETCNTRNDIHEDLDLAIHLHNNKVEILYEEKLRVGVEMKRVYSSDKIIHKRRMQMWPDTLYAHGLKRAWLGTVGAGFLYHGRYVVRSGEAIARIARSGKTRLEVALDYFI